MTGKIGAKIFPFDKYFFDRIEKNGYEECIDYCVGLRFFKCRKCGLPFTVREKEYKQGESLDGKIWKVWQSNQEDFIQELITRDVFDCVENLLNKHREVCKNEQART